jgi:hypothetical protein
MIDLKWHEGASCKGHTTDTFYLDEFENTEAINRLRRLCKTCPVFEECRDHSLTWEAFGFWAGMTESERRDEKRLLNITRKSISRTSAKGAGYGSYKG